MPLAPPPSTNKVFNWIWVEWIYKFYEWVLDNTLKDYSLEVARGNINGVSGVNKYGTNEAVGTSFEDVWIQGGTWTRLAAATTLEVASSDANDTSAGSGAQTLFIDGLDANYDVLTETVTLNGQTPVVTTGVFLFVNRMYVLTAGGGELNAGTIYAADDSGAWTSGVPDTMSLLQSSIKIGHGQTQQAIYTCPRNKTAYIIGGYVLASASKTVTFEFRMHDNVEDTNRTLFDGDITNTSFQREYTPYAQALPKSTLLVRAKVDSTTASVAAGFDLYLVDS